MKLAREIAEALFPINANTRRYNHGMTREREAQREAATPIIAAKLEPVREALRSAWAGEVCGPEMCCESPACKQVAEIWESLSEE